VIAELTSPLKSTLSRSDELVVAGNPRGVAMGKSDRAAAPVEGGSATPTAFAKLKRNAFGDGGGGGVEAEIGAENVWKSCHFAGSVARIFAGGAGGGGGRENLAVTDKACFSVRLQVAVPVHAPDQPEKVELLAESGVAVSRTVVP